jgi:hypothetical protein
MAATAPPIVTVGLGFTVTVLVSEIVPQDPPLVVSVKVTGVVDKAAAV